MLPIGPLQGMMALGPLQGLMQGFSGVGSLMKIDEANSIFEDDTVTESEFNEMMRQILTNLGEGAGEDDPDVGEMTENLSAPIFRILDTDQNGVLEGEETEQLRAILAYFNPELWGAPEEEPVEEPVEEEPGPEVPPDPVAPPIIPRRGGL